MKLTFQFLLLIGALLGSVAASAVAGWLALGTLDQSMTQVVNSDMERLLSITHTRRLFRSMVVLERDYLLSKSDTERAPMDTKMAKAEKDLLEQIDKYSRLMPAEDAKVIESLRGVRERWIALDDRVRVAAKSGSPEAIALAAQHDKDPVSWETVIGGLVKASETRLATQAEKTHETFRHARRTLVWVSVGAAFLAVALGGAIFRAISRNIQHVENTNRNLDKLVRDRTESLVARERALRLILDSTGDAIIGLGADGMLVGVRSAAAEAWFGPAEVGKSAAAYLFPHDANAELFFIIGIEGMLDGIMPWEVLVAQAPRTLKRDGRVLELDYRNVEDGTDGIRLLVLARDVTARVESEIAEVAAKEQHSLVSRLLSDKRGFASFVADTENLLQRLASEKDAIVARRDLHTLKGNVALFGLTTVASRCHQVEDRLEGNDLPSAAEVADLTDLFRKRLASIENFISGLSRSVVEVQTEEREALVKSLLEQRDYREILTMVELWSWPKTGEHLTRLRAQAELVAKRLGKQLRVEVDHGELRIPSDYLQSFWSTLVHVVRNAVDHGIESPAARVAQGKPELGTLTLKTWQSDTQFGIEVTDDGAGIDSNAVRAAAERLGVIATESGVEDLIFADGLSTKADVTDISGRGVGLAAVRAECEKAGGELTLHSTKGRGTHFVFTFQRPVVKADRLAVEFERNWSLVPRSANVAIGGAANQQSKVVKVAG